MMIHLLPFPVILGICGLMLGSIEPASQEAIASTRDLGPILTHLAVAPEPPGVHRPEFDLKVWEQRSKAVAECCRMGTNAWPAVQALLLLASHPNFQIAVGAATILASIRTDEHPQWDALQLELRAQTNAIHAFDYLVAGKDEYSRAYLPTQRRFALTALGVIGPAAQTIAPTLIRLFSFKSIEERNLWAAAVATLQRLHVEPGQFIPGLRHCLADPDEEIDVRVCAARALAATNSPDSETLALLHQQLQDSHSQVRIAAARALWTLHTDPDQIMPILLPLLNHKLVTIRTETLLALADVGTAASGARPTIHSLLADPSETVRSAAAVALERIPEVPNSSQKLDVRTDRPGPLPSAPGPENEFRSFAAEGTFGPPNPLGKSRFTFQYRHGWWQVELTNRDPSNGGPALLNCMKIPDGIRFFTLFSHPTGGLPVATACPSAFPPAGLAGGLFECWLSLCPYPDLPIIDDGRLHRFLNVPACEPELDYDPRGIGDYQVNYLQPRGPFISELSVTNNGFWIDMESGGRLVFAPYAHPFEKGGFAELTYQVTDSTNLQGIIFPLRTVFNRYGPHLPGKAADGTLAGQTLEMIVTQIRFLDSDSGRRTTPAPPVVFAMDYRPSDYTVSGISGSRYLGTIVTNDQWTPVRPRNRTFRIIPTAEELGPEWSRELGLLFEPVSGLAEEAPHSAAVPESVAQKIRASVLENWDGPVTSWGQAQFHARSGVAKSGFEVQVQRYNSRTRLKADFEKLWSSVPSGLGEKQTVPDIGEGAVLFSSAAQPRTTLWFFQGEHLAWITPLGPAPQDTWQSSRTWKHLAQVMTLKIAAANGPPNEP